MNAVDRDPDDDGRDSVDHLIVSLGCGCGFHTWQPALASAIQPPVGVARRRI